MEFFIARHPVFNRRKQVFGYKLFLCQSFRDHYYEMHSEPDDAEELYRQLCFAVHNESPDQPKALIEFSDDLIEKHVSLLPKEHVIVECDLCDNSELTNMDQLEKIKSQQYRVAFNAKENISQKLIELSDIVRIDFSALNLKAQIELMENILEAQLNCMENVTKKVMFLAYHVETWDDFEKALAIGYDYFQGNFFLKPLRGKRSDIRSFNTIILRVISELGVQVPRIKEITNIIEHDLNLSYSLLKLVNSAYIAPKYKVKTISQAVVTLGLNELNKFMAAMILKEAQSPENIELLRCSLIRGKLMELLTYHKNIPQQGSEAFFTGIFSLIDVILNRKMEEIINELPLTETVIDALTGKENSLQKLLHMVIDYEQADWDSFLSVYKLDIIEQEELMNLYITAIKWVESLDF